MTLVLDLAPEVEAKLEQKAALLGVTVPDLIMKMVEDTAAKEAEPRKPYGAAAALQLAEEIHATIPEEEWSKLPPDWATNPDKYRFGYAKDEE